jgi:hypothetical protein
MSRGDLNYKSGGDPEEDGRFFPFHLLALFLVFLPPSSLLAGLACCSAQSHPRNPHPAGKKHHNCADIGAVLSLGPHFCPKVQWRRAITRVEGWSAAIDSKVRVMAYGHRRHRMTSINIDYGVIAAEGLAISSRLAPWRSSWPISGIQPPSRARISPFREYPFVYTTYKASG